ncbi:MAG: PilN domain-containing protein [Desulfobacterales bacterium]
MQKKILGLDICEGSISAVLLKSSLRENRITFQKHLLLPPASENSLQQIMENIESLAQSISIPPDITAVSFPSGLISFRNLTTPFKNHQKIQQILPFELEPTMPSPVENLVIDFFLTEHNEENHVIAASLNREVFETYLENLSKAGFDPSHVSPSGYATVAGLIRFSELPRQSMVVHLDRHTLTAYELIFQKLVLIRSFRVPASDQSRIESIARNLLQTLTASEEILSQEFFPEHLWLTGTDDNLDLLSKFLKDKLQIPNSILDISSISKLQTEISDGTPAVEGLNNALGLALAEAGGFGGLNFRKGRFAIKSHWIEHKAAMVRTGIIAALTVLIFFCLFFFENHLLQNNLDRLNKEINHIFTSTFPEVTKIVDPVHQMEIHISEITKEQQIPAYGLRAVRAIDVLNEISRRIANDADVELTQLILGSENLQLSGTAATFNAVNEIRNQLEPVTFFKSVMISSATVERFGERIQFKINIDL